MTLIKPLAQPLPLVTVVLVVPLEADLGAGECESREGVLSTENPVPSPQ